MDCDKSFDIGNKLKTIAIIQARYKSTRLQGKILLNLDGNTVLGNVIRRLQKCKEIDGIIVATSTEPEDSLVVQEATKNGALYFCGSQNDVLDRYYRCAKFFGAERVVRITADCPYIMPDVVDRLLQESYKNGVQCEYGSNVKKRTYPKGFDCEVFSFDELERTARFADLEEDREHVTPFMRRSCVNFSLEDNEDYSHKRITLDTWQDYQDLQSYPLGNVYNYEECKKLLNQCISTEERNIAMELGHI